MVHVFLMFKNGVNFLDDSSRLHVVKIARAA